MTLYDVRCLSCIFVITGMMHCGEDSPNPAQAQPSPERLALIIIIIVIVMGLSHDKRPPKRSRPPFLRKGATRHVRKGAVRFHTMRRRGGCGVAPRGAWDGAVPPDPAGLLAKVVQ